MATDIKKYQFKPGLPQEFEILDLSELYQSFSKEMVSPHRVEFYQIIWFTKGNPTHLVDFGPVHIRPNTILFLRKDMVQSFDENGDFDGKSILFTSSFFCQTQADSAFLNSSILFNDLLSLSKIKLTDTNNIFTELLEQMRQELAKNSDLYQADILRNFLRNFLLAAERERRKQDFIEVKKGPDLEYVMNFKNLLEDQFQKQKLVHTYASEMGITDKRLNQATSKVLALSPKQMIDARIMLEAKRLLAHTSLSVKEIGFQLGFDEPTNFVKYFRKHHLATPLEFRSESKN